MDLSLRGLAKQVGISHTAIARVETEHEKATIRTAQVVQEFFGVHRIYFGPSNGVSVNSNAFSEGRWLSLAALQIAVNHGCGSKELLDARHDAEDAIANGGDVATNELATHVRALCEFVREPDGECGCHLLAPEEGPCVVCEAEAALFAAQGGRDG